MSKKPDALALTWAKLDEGVPLDEADRELLSQMLYKLAVIRREFNLDAAFDDHCRRSDPDIRKLSFFYHDNRRYHRLWRDEAIMRAIKTKGSVLAPLVDFFMAHDDISQTAAQKLAAKALGRTFGSVKGSYYTARTSKRVK